MSNEFTSQAQYPQRLPGIGQFKVELTKALLIYSPPQHEQYYRPLQTNIQGEQMQGIFQATNNGACITPVALASIAPQIISPSATPYDKVNIEHGLCQGRYAFFLELTRETPMGVEREIITGFTDHDGVSYGGAIDNYMKFYVNSRTVIAEKSTVGMMGDNISMMMRDNNSVFSPIPDQPYAQVMRPEDAVAYQHTKLIRNGFSGQQVINTKFNLNRGPARFGDKDHAIPGKYMSDIFTGYMKGSNPNESNEYADPGDTYADIMTHLSKGEQVTRSAYVSELAQHNVEKSSCFTFMDINNRWPRHPDFWIVQKPVFGSSLSIVTDYCEHWAGATPETEIAYSITHILPSLITNQLLTCIDVTITNNTPNGQIMISIMNSTAMFPGLFMPHNLVFLQGQIEMHIVRGLVLPKAGLFDIMISMDVLTNSVMDISLNGHPHIRYNAPIFCSSKYSPLISLDDSTLGNLAQGMELIAGNLIDSRPNAYPQHTQNPNPFVAPITNQYKYSPKPNPFDL